MMWYLVNSKNRTMFELTEHGSFWKAIYNQKNFFTKPKVMRKLIHNIILRYGGFIYNRKYVQVFSNDLYDFVSGADLEKEIILLEDSYNPYSLSFAIQERCKNFLILRTYNYNDELKFGVNDAKMLSKRQNQFPLINFLWPISKIRKLLIFT